MLKAVLFDMDGVLVDSEPEYKKVEQGLCRELGFILSDEEKEKSTGTSTFDTWTALKEKYGLKESPEELTEAESRRMGEFYRNGKLIPIELSVSLLKECAAKGVKIAVATSAVRYNAEAVIERLEIKDKVNALVSADMVERSKPAPDIFLKAAEILGVSQEDCVVIEDSKNGITAAKNAGMKAIGLKSPENPQDLSEADALVSTTDNIGIEFLKKLVEQK